MASERIFFTKSNDERCALKRKEVAHYHQHGRHVKLHMTDGWVYTVVATFDEIVLLLDPEPADDELRIAS